MPPMMVIGCLKRSLLTVEGGLHAAGIVRDPRHQKARTHFVKEIHRTAEHLAEELAPDISHHLVADPLHQ